MAVFPALFGLLMAAAVTGQYVEITPRNAVVRVGDKVDVLCKVAYPIQSCRITVGLDSYLMNPDVQEGDVVYFGQGMKSGECGATIRNIRMEWNGNVSCALPSQTSNIEISGVMRLLVAKAPTQLILNAPQEPTFIEGKKFEAQCMVRDGRPAAKITWFLDTEELLNGFDPPVVTSDPSSDLQTISQNISRILSVEDDGRTLECKAEHEALEQPLSAKRQLIIQYPPKGPESGTITIFGLKLGEPGQLNVSVRANPPPTAEWTVGDLQITTFRSSDDGAIYTIEPIHTGNGFYNVTLLLSRITKKDVERTYYLRVSNLLGSKEYAVRISTMEEPAGMELDTGAIVGIVVAVLIVLIAIFLGVFAFATERWCFAGRKRDHTKSSGESTAAGDVLLESGNTLPRNDTESAVGGRERSRLAGLGARVMAALPRAKDKVQATETHAVDTDDKPLSDEKKAVVYAELALGDQNAEKPPPPSAEYAEIVYTEQPPKQHETTQ